MVYLAVFLIVSFPVASSSIINFKVYGDDEVDGFMKGPGDKTVFEAHISSQDTVSLSDLSIRYIDYGNAVYYFDDVNFCYTSSCVQGEPTPENPNIFICKCKTNFAHPLDKTELQFNFLSHVRGKDLYRDYLPPKINEADLIQKEGKLFLNLDVIDEGSDLHKGKCVGLSRVIVINDEGYVFNYDLPSTCIFNDEIELDFAQDGTFNFDIKVVDRFWNNPGDDSKHSYVKKINNHIVDFTDPIIYDTFSFKKNGIELNYISNQELKGDLSILIDEPNLKEVTLLSNYNNPLTPNNTPCQRLNNNIFNCTFEDIKIRLYEDNTLAQFELKAEDIRGNEVTKLIIKQFSPAYSRPRVSFIGTTGYYERLSTSFVKNNDNTILIKVQNAYAGFDNNDVTINLGVFNNLGNSVKADRCYKENDIWFCEWDVSLSVNHNSDYLVTLGTSRDLAGNTLSEGYTSIYLKSDVYKPSIIEINSYTNFNGDLIPFHKTGDNIIIVANVTDSSGIKKALGNFSDAYSMSSGNLETANCVYRNGNYICEWTTQNVRSGLHDANVKLYFYDHAGNVKERSFEFRIHNPSDDEPDCYEVFIHNIQPVEYNSVRAFAGGQVYPQMVPFHLLSKCVNGKAFNIELEHVCSVGEIYFDEVECTSLNNKISGYNGNNKGKCYTGYFTLPLTPQNFVNAYDSGQGFIIGLDQESMCGISSYVVRQNFFYNQKEYNPIAFNIPITNNLFPPDKGIKKEINDILTKRGEYAKIMTDLDKIFTFARKICEIKYVFDTIEAAYIAIKTVFEAIKLAAGSLTFGSAYALLTAKEAGTVTPSYLATITAKNTFLKVIMWTCAAISCDNTYVAGGNEQINMDEGTTIDPFSTETGGKFFVFPGGFLPPAHRLITKIYKWADSGEETVFRIDGAGIPASPRELAMSNIYFSILGLCIPGVIHNLNKKNQLECWRGYCYAELIPLGMTKEQCDGDYRYQKCVFTNSYVTGLIKYFGIDRFSKMITRSITQPESLAWPGLSLVNSLGCAWANDGITKSIFCAAKAIMIVIENTITVYKTIESFFGDWDYEETQRDYCAYLRDIVEEDPTWVDMDTGRWGELYGEGIDT